MMQPEPNDIQVGPGVRSVGPSDEGHQFEKYAEAAPELLVHLEETDDARWLPRSSLLNTPPYG